MKKSLSIMISMARQERCVCVCVFRLTQIQCTSVLGGGGVCVYRWGTYSWQLQDYYSQEGHKIFKGEESYLPINTGVVS